MVCVCKHECVFVEAETVSAGGVGTTYRVLSGSYQIRELPEQDQSAPTAELSVGS